VSAQDVAASGRHEPHESLTDHHSTALALIATARRGGSLSVSKTSPHAALFGRSDQMHPLDKPRAEAEDVMA
jgi:hypothetical protein